jgi:hypothetical protein
MVGVTRFDGCLPALHESLLGFDKRERARHRVGISFSVI